MTTKNKFDFSISETNKNHCGKQCIYLKYHNEKYRCLLFSTYLKTSFLNKENVLRCKDCKIVENIYKKDDKKGI